MTAPVILLLLVSTLAQDKSKDKKAADEPPQITVKVKRAVIRRAPTAAAELVKTATEGTTFVLMGTESGWAKVEYEKGKAGYLHKSAWVDKKEYVPPPPEGNDQGTRPSGELALGTKGFNPTVEQAYIKEKNLGAYFKMLDTRVIPKPDWKRHPEEVEHRVRAFVQEGKLKP